MALYRGRPKDSDFEGAKSIESTYDFLEVKLHRAVGGPVNPSRNGTKSKW